MTAPERIWAARGLYWPDRDRTFPPPTEYIRHDAAALAASPVVQDMIRQAVEAEREACAKVADDTGKPFARMFIMRKLAGLGYNISVRSKQRMCIRIAAAILARGE